MRTPIAKTGIPTAKLCWDFSLPRFLNNHHSKFVQASEPSREMFLPSRHLRQERRQFCHKEMMMFLLDNQGSDLAQSCEPSRDGLSRTRSVKQNAKRAFKALFAKVIKGTGKCGKINRMQVLLKNILVNYEQVGEGSENLLILHGWGQSLAPWRNTAQFCSKKYKVTLVDFPGFGSSEEPYSVWDTYEYADFIKDFLAKLGIKDTVIMGHSFGGRIGTIIASKYPEIVSRLILVDASGIEIKSLAIKLKIILYKIFIKPVRRIFSESIKRLLGSSDYQAVSGTMRQVFVKVVNQDLRHLFNSIKLPTVVIWGSNDQVLPVEYVKIYKSLIPHAEIKIIWGADHGPNLSKPSDFLVVLSDVLKI